MYKKFKIDLVATNIIYNEEVTLVKCSFNMSDPSVNTAPEGEPARFKNQGSWSVDVEFPVGSEPSKDEILAAVRDLEGVVSQYA